MHPRVSQHGVAYAVATVEPPEAQGETAVEQEATKQQNGGQLSEQRGGGGEMSRGKEDGGEDVSRHKEPRRGPTRW